MTLSIMAGILIFGMPGNTLYSHISVLYQSTGFEAMDISWLLSIFGIALMIGKCACGQIADKMGTYRSSWILYIMTAVGTALCCLAGNGSFAVASAGVIFMGFGAEKAVLLADLAAFILMFKYLDLKGWKTAFGEGAHDSIEAVMGTAVIVGFGGVVTATLFYDSVIRFIVNSNMNVYLLAAAFSICKTDHQHAYKHLLVTSALIPMLCVWAIDVPFALIFG